MKRWLYTSLLIFIMEYPLAGMEGSISGPESSIALGYKDAVPVVVERLIAFDESLVKAFKQWPRNYSDQAGHEEFIQFITSSQPIDFEPQTTLLAEQLANTALQEGNPILTWPYELHLFTESLSRLYFGCTPAEESSVTTSIKPYSDLSPDARTLLKKYFLMCARGSMKHGFTTTNPEKINEKLKKYKDYGALAILTTIYHDQEKLAYHLHKKQQNPTQRTSSLRRGLAYLIAGAGLGLWELLCNNGRILASKTLYQFSACISFLGISHIMKGTLKTKTFYKHAAKASKWRRRLKYYKITSLFQIDDFHAGHKHSLTTSLYHAADYYKRLVYEETKSKD